MAIDAKEADMDAFMEKPFKLDELTAVYINLLARDQRNQGDITGTPGVDAGPTSLRAITRGRRSIRNVTPNAKIFVDASESNAVVASQAVGSTDIVTMTESPENGAVKPTFDLVLPPISQNGMIKGINLTTKVHAMN